MATRGGSGRCGARHRWILLALALTTVGAVLAIEPSCPAKSNTNWLRHYPEACEPLRAAAQDCTLCHDTITDLNPYGLDLADVANQPWLIEHLDSDEDGRTNLEEIEDCTLPGDPTSVPATSTTWSRLKAPWR